MVILRYIHKISSIVGSQKCNSKSTIVSFLTLIFSLSNSVGTNYYLLRDGVVVDTGYFYFNNGNVHHTLPPLWATFSSESGAHTYSISIGSNITVDTQDRAIMIIQQY